MSKSSISIFFIIVTLLSLCSSIHIDEEVFGGETYYESAANGFWPMPAGNILNNGQTDMGELTFSGVTQSLDNWEGVTRSPPIIDREGFVYTLQKTNTSINKYICTIECYDPTGDDHFLWSRDLPDYPVDYPCERALLVFNVDSTTESETALTALIDGYMYFFQLNANHSIVPNNVDPEILAYKSSILIPVAEGHYVIDDLGTHELHLIHYIQANNGTGNHTSGNHTTNGTSDAVQRFFTDYPLSIKALDSYSPALQVAQIQDSHNTIHKQETATYVYTVLNNTLTAYSLLTRSTAWVITLPTNQHYMSNVAICANTSVIYVLVLIANPTYTVALYGYTHNQSLIHNVSLETPAGVETRPGRISIDNTNGRILSMFEDQNNTWVYSYDYTNNTLTNRSLGEANFQGPMSIDYTGSYYVITSQYSGYLALRSGDLTTESRVLNTEGGTITGVNRNYAAVGNKTLVVTGSGGAIGFAPVRNDHSSSHGSKTWIILLCVFAGIIFIIFLIAVACLIYHYWNKNKKRHGYEVV